jgi:predicted O-methyltransferase YrrM
VNPEPFFRLLDSLERFSREFEAIGRGEEHRPPQPRWDQDWFPRLDAAVAYAMVRDHPPRRIVEVGSGHSTRFLARAVADGKLQTQITAIDPEPRARLDGLQVELISRPVQQIDEKYFRNLDVLFVDSSHQLKQGSDVEFIFSKVIPLLPTGAHVHFHDIFLPDPYPAHWAWRRYNEQAAVAALLQGGYACEFSSHWVVSRRPDLVARGVLGRLPLVAGAIESSLWLRKS